jgi:hypothetical protein
VAPAASSGRGGGDVALVEVNSLLRERGTYTLAATTLRRAPHARESPRPRPRDGLRADGTGGLTAVGTGGRGDVALRPGVTATSCPGLGGAFGFGGAGAGAGAGASASTLDELLSLGGKSGLRGDSATWEPLGFGGISGLRSESALGKVLPNEVSPLDSLRSAVGFGGASGLADGAVVVAVDVDVDVAVAVAVVGRSAALSLAARGAAGLGGAIGRGVLAGEGGAAAETDAGAKSAALRSPLGAAANTLLLSPQSGFGGICGRPVWRSAGVAERARRRAGVAACA